MKKLLATGVLAVCWLTSSNALGQPASFTYQGQLKQQGFPVNDLADMKFQLFDSDTAETPVAGPLVFDGLNFPSVQLSSGLFSVELDFGIDALQQGGQWLEIAIRSPHDGSDAGAYTTLTPRQRLTAAPFALSVPGLATTAAGVEVEGDIHAFGHIAASAYTSNSPLIFKVNPLDMECARFEDMHCYLGLGTTDPQAKLHVGGVAGVDGIMFPDGTLQTTAAGNVVGGDSVWSLANSGGIFYSQGNVGVGTSAPAAKLDIAASGEGAELLRFSTERPWVFRQVYTGPSASLRLFSTTGQKRFEITANDLTNVATFLADSVNSKVGIGTTAPASKLDITATGDGAELLRFSTERPWVFRQIRTGPSAGLQLLSTVGQKAFELTAVNGENVATFLADGTNSRVGIGTTGPTLGTRLDVIGYTGDAVHAIHVGSATTAAVSGVSLTVNGNGLSGRADIGSGAYGVWGQAASGIGGYFTGGTYAMVADGRAKVGLLEIAGADVAEKFPSSDENVEPGTVMEIDPEHAGALRVAHAAYSTLVAGIVSGAGDIPVGAVLGNLPGHEKAPAIALSGRVWVRCDASTSAIAPGDLLTTSDTPGHAMKALNLSRAHGTVIGKAMTSLAQGETGLVLVLVSLQ
ncbi:MAG: hypothetical protein HY287_13175 [Planctomycetes bacterium]|nr:hypothetical protein [Planctomycetota bacterium]MBI3835274.1 hypothetical protein [Planctomycetota bacterium]